MPQLISDVIAYFASLALAGFLIHAVYTITVGLYRRTSLRYKLNYFVLRAILFIGWLSILISYFLPDNNVIYIAVLAKVINFTFFTGIMLYTILAIPIIAIIIAIGKSAKVYFKNGEIIIYPVRYSSDDEYYYFRRYLQISKGEKEIVKKDSVEKIENVRNYLFIADLINVYGKLFRAVDKFALLDTLIVMFGMFILCVIFALVSILPIGLRAFTFR